VAYESYRYAAVHWHQRSSRSRRPDEELAKKLRADTDLQLLYIQKLQAGEPVDELLLATHRPILRSIINRSFRQQGHEWADLWQEGRLGIIEALLPYRRDGGGASNVQKGEPTRRVA
jgi:hypothetical protein